MQFWDNVELIKDAVKDTDDAITRWKLRRELGYSVKECVAMLKALYDEQMDLLNRLDELGDTTEV